MNACAICLESMKDNVAALRCGHVFHNACVKHALTWRPACPICRHKATAQSAIQLYLSIGTRKKRPCQSNSRFHNDRNDSMKVVDYRYCKGSSRSESRLPERMRLMRMELNRASEIQRMTSSHSFRLENELARCRQEQEQTQRQMLHIQHELDIAKTKLKRLQRIASASYSQCKEAKHAKLELLCKVRTTADRMLEKVRVRQRICCPSCKSQWAEMKRAARDFANAAEVNSSCERHGRH